MEKICLCKPVNKIAAIVANQKNCTDGQLTKEQLRENLVKKIKILNEQIVNLPKGEKRKQIGKEIHELSKQINAIRPAKKTGFTITDFFIDEIRDYLTKPIFNMLMDKAVIKYKKEHNEK